MVNQTKRTLPKVLHLIDGLNVGGAEKSMLEILSRFRRTEPLVAYLFVGGALRPAYEQAGVRVIGLDIEGRYDVHKMLIRTLRLLRDEQPDLLYLAGFYAGIVGRIAARWLGIPVVDSFTNEAYSAAHYANVPKRSRWKLRVAQALDAWTLRRVSAVIAISHTVRHHNATSLRVPLEKVHVIYRGRDPEVWANPDNKAQAHLFRARYMPDPKGSLLVNVARLIPRKGQYELFQAVARLLPSNPSLHLLVAGDGWYREALESSIRELKLEAHVHLLGTVHDVPALLQAADLFVFPSRYEGHGGALVEAMFAARPIVASDTPVHRESIDHGETGLLVPVGDPAALAEAIAWMLDHPEEAREMGRRARAVALERFHIDRIAAQHEELYARVLADWQARRSP